LSGYREKIAERLAPELVRQADELLRHRRREYMTVSDNLRAPAAGARQQVAGLAEAFGRVVDLYRRAVTLSNDALRQQVAERVAEAERLADTCRRLEAGL
jgi:hypothetical protein